MTGTTTRTAALLLALCTACTVEAPVGYSGPLPSSAALALVAGLQGAELVGPGGATVVVGPFGVVPNPVTGKGPVVRLDGAAGETWLPLLSDGDVADLVRRATGSAPPDLVGPLSEPYRRVLGP